MPAPRPPKKAADTVPRLPALLDQLRAALEDPGAKSEFARQIERETGVTFRSAKNTLSRHLHGRQAPSGEDVLRILAFLARTD